MPGENTADIPRLTGAKLKGKNGHVYEFQQMIGSGQFGVVYMCEDAASSQRYACKVMNMSAFTNSLQVIEREVDILKRIEHERVLSCHEQLCAGNLLFVFTQFVPGGSLADYLNKHIMTIDEVGRTVYQILQGVAYLHSHNICHRDLKPDNILCTDTDPVNFIIADFGLSRTFDPNGGLMDSHCGSSLYAAPEVFNSSYTAECDMYSVGIITNEMIRGPFSSTPLHSLEYDSSVPGVVRDFVGQLLQYEPQKRISAENALKHPWMVEIAKKFYPSEQVPITDDAKGELPTATTQGDDTKMC